jgi:hypothetical protein
MIAKQWCLLHGSHQDDPNHDYTYPECERNLRPATWLENLRVRLTAIRH